MKIFHCLICMCFFVLFLTIWGCTNGRRGNLDSVTITGDSLKVVNYIQKIQELNIEKITKLSEYRSIQDSLNKVLLISEKINSPQLIYRLNEIYSKVYSNSNNYSISLEYDFKNLESIESLYSNLKNDTAAINKVVQTLFSISFNYYGMGNPKKALCYFNKALQVIQNRAAILSKKTYIDRLFACYNNIGSMYLLLGDAKNSKLFFSKALTLFENPANKGYIAGTRAAFIDNNLGILASMNNDLDEAEKNYKLALELWTKEQDKAGLARVYNNLGKFYFQKEEYAQSLTSLEKAYSYGKESQNIQSQLVSVTNLHDYYEHFSDYKNGFKYQELVQLFKDSITRTAQVVQVTQAELKYQYEKKMKNTQIQLEEKKADYLKKKNNWIAIVSISIFLMIVLIILVILYGKQKKRNKQILHQEEELKIKNQLMENQIELKDKELASNTLLLLNKSDLITSVSEKLSSVELNTQREENLQIKNIISELNRNKDNGLGKELQHRLQNLDKKFLVLLIQKHPDLTPNEIKLCTFLKMNLSTKDISEITHQTIRSIEAARTRLRKKLKLTRDENLTVYLQKI